MKSDRKKIFETYGDGWREDKRAYGVRSKQQEFYYSEKIIREFLSDDSIVLDLGCATGYYAEKLSPHCRQYIGVDFFEPHIQILKSKIEEKNWDNVSALVGEATALDMFDDGHFDVVLCLGPMYHLSKEERERVFDECKRVCKPGGVVIFSYINKLGFYLGSCLEDDLYIKEYLNKKTNRLVLEMETDDKKPGVMFYTTPKDIEEIACAHGLEKIKNVAVDFLIASRLIDTMTDVEFEVFKPLLEEMVATESCTGLGYHALLVCKNCHV